MDTYFRHIITKRQERRINNKAYYLIIGIMSAAILIIMAITQVCISISELYKILFVENYHYVSKTLTSTEVGGALLILAIFIFSILRSTIQPYDKFIPNKKLFSCLYIGKKYLFKEQGESIENKIFYFKKIKEYKMRLVLNSISMSIIDVIDNVKTISIFYDTESDIELYKIQTIFSSKFKKMVLNQKNRNQILDFISLLLNICYAYMPQKNYLYSNDELIQLKKEAEKKKEVLATLTEEILTISLSEEEDIIGQKKNSPILWAQNIKFGKLLKNSFLLNILILILILIVVIVAPIFISNIIEPILIKLNVNKNIYATSQGTLVVVIIAIFFTKNLSEKRK